jgi:tetratricopeptide (TPR) repeat protein
METQMIGNFLARAAAAVLVSASLDASAHEIGGQDLGQVNFGTSCDAKVQPIFERGVALLHSFWFAEAGKTFDEVIAQDPDCAIAYWGLAVNLLGNPLASSPPLKNLQAATAALDKARTIDVKTSRERDWLAAIGAYYADYDKTPLEARQVAYTRAMEQMSRRYPLDDEVQIYYALALQASAPKDDKTYADQRKAARILEQQFAKNPQHPGAAHYLIHAYDFPPLAPMGLPAAKKYATIAPASAHARHMPSHIYSMLGLWEESIASNGAAVAVQPDYYHARDFAVYAHLQLGQDMKARAAIADAQETLKRLPAQTNGYRNGVAAMPARYALERGDWAGAAALPVSSNGWAYADSLVRFARGLGMARSGDAAGAKQEVAALVGLRGSLEEAHQSYWAARVEEEALAVSGWIALAEGDRDRAEKLLRAAADGEDGSIKQVEMEIRLYPMRECLADFLLQTGRPADALREYERTLAENPNRFRGLYGAARAAEAAHREATSTEYFKRVVALTQRADGERPETTAAKGYLASR